jgi:hypothetical protein
LSSSATNRTTVLARSQIVVARHPRKYPCPDRISLSPGDTAVFRLTSDRTTRTTDTGRSILDTISSLWYSEGSFLHRLEDAWDQGNSFTRGSMIGAGALLLGGLALGSAYLGTRLTDYDFGRTPPSSPPCSIALQGDNLITKSLVDRLDDISGWTRGRGPSAATGARSAAASVGSAMQQASQAASDWYGAARSRLTDLDGSVLGILRDRWS